MKRNITEEAKEYYYFYHNWTSSNRINNKIHKGSCSDCNHGKGKIGMEEKGKRSIWIGPFETPELAEKYLKRIGIDDHLNKRHKCLTDE